MISSAQAFEIAHNAIANKRYHDAACDITIERAANEYTVTFSRPSMPGAPGPGATRVVVDASSGAVRKISNASEPTRDAALVHLISGKRALDAGLEQVSTLAITYDERGTITVLLARSQYCVTFPVPERHREFEERADYALRVWVNSRTGKVLKALGGP